MGVGMGFMCCCNSKLDIFKWSDFTSSSPKSGTARLRPKKGLNIRRKWLPFVSPLPYLCCQSEKWGDSATSQRDQVAIHQHVRAGNQLRTDGVPQTHHCSFPHREEGRLPRYSIGDVGLTQLFHEKSELLMMATNRIRIDLNSNNNNIVGLVLCVLSEICTAELAKDLHLDVLKVNSMLVSVSATALLTFGRKLSSQLSKLWSECHSTSGSSSPRSAVVLRRRVMVCF